MSRVYMGTQPWGVFQDAAGQVQSGVSVLIKNRDGSNATHYSARTAGTSTTGAISTNSSGLLTRWIDPGEYTLTANAVTYDIDAVSGSVETAVAGLGVVAIGTGIDYTGVTESTAAVQAKMDLVPPGGRIIFPHAGLVRCTGTLVRTVTQGEIHFIGGGAGSGGTTLHLQHATLGLDIQGTTGDPIVGVSFDHINVRGNGTIPATLVKMTSCWVVVFSSDTEVFDAPLLIEFNGGGHITLDGMINWNQIGSQVGYRFSGGVTDVKFGGQVEGITGGSAKVALVENSLSRDFRFVGVHVSEDVDYFLHVNTGGVDGLTVSGCTIRHIQQKAIVNEVAASTRWRINGNVLVGAGDAASTHGIHCTAGTDIVESNNSISGFTNEVVIPTPSVASAATITLPGGPWTQVTGTTTITSITASRPGRVVTLQFTGILTLTDGSNLKLAGNYVTTADDTITLLSDGTNWIETARSVN